MRIALCEDDAADGALLREAIERYCQRNCYLCDITCFTGGEALLASFEPGAFDAVFMDIYLTGMTGIEAARVIREQDANCLLVMVTVSKEHALDGYSVQAVAYVNKPADQAQIDKALHMCRQAFERNSRLITVPLERGNTVDIALALVQYVEVYGRETLFHMGGGTITARLSLDEVEAKLGGAPFLRCHRCYIVNMNHIAGVMERDFRLKNGDVVPIRKSGRSEAKTCYAEFLAGPASWSGAS